MGKALGNFSSFSGGGCHNRKWSKSAFFGEAHGWRVWCCVCVVCVGFCVVTKKCVVWCWVSLFLWTFSAALSSVAVLPYWAVVLFVSCSGACQEKNTVYLAILLLCVTFLRILLHKTKMRTTGCATSSFVTLGRDISLCDVRCLFALFGGNFESLLEMCQSEFELMKCD